MPGIGRRQLERIGAGDRRYLTQPRGPGTTWYVALDVPRPLRGVIGAKRLIRSAETSDITLARAVRFKVLAEFQERIERSRAGVAATGEALREEAVLYREALRTAANADDQENIRAAIDARVEALAYRADRSRYSVPAGEPEPDLPAIAGQFQNIALGFTVGIEEFLERWLTGTTFRDRTKADARTAVRQFAEWHRSECGDDTLRTVADRVASDYRDNVLGAPGAHPRTGNKKLSLLRGYWAWLRASFPEYVGERNPWKGKSLRERPDHAIAPGSAGERERPFTDDEVAALLRGNADGDIADLMRIAALSGMRLEEIGQLRVGDVVSGAFQVRSGKTAAARRSIPIHSALKRIVASRTKGKDAADYLFPAFRATGWDGNRTMAVSKRFRTYRKRVGVDDRREGSRRSKVNFHSFRRWFATKCEDAGQPENVVAAIMGHERGRTESFRTYSQASLAPLKRVCVEAVRLPRGL